MQIIKNFAKGVMGEMKLRKFCFKYKYPEQFYKSQWQSRDRSAYFLIYRWSLAGFFAAVFGACLALQLADGKLFIFLTNWGILLCLLTQFIATWLSTCWYFDVAGVRSVGYKGGAGGVLKDQVHTPLLVQLYWLLHGVALSLALVITTIYWAFLHGNLTKPPRFPIISFITHCLNSVFMMVDFLVVAFPVRILHTVYWMMLPISYCLFTVVYYFCGGVDEHGNHYVYPLLDWKYPVKGMTTFAGVFCLYVIYAIVLFSACKFKRYLARILKTMGNPHAVGMI